MSWKTKASAALLSVALLALLLACGCTDTSGTEAAALTESLSSANQTEQRAAAEDLVAMGAPAVKPLISALSDNTNNAGTWAATALCEIGEPAVEPLIEALASEDNSTRVLAVNSLACIGTSNVGRLLEVSVSSGNSRVSEGADFAIVKMGKAAIPALELQRASLNPDISSKATALITSVGMTERLKARKQAEGGA